MPIPNSQTGAPSAAQPRGRLMRPKAVRTEFFHNQVSEWWVRRNVAPDKRIKLGHSTLMWYEHDVAAWVEQRKAS